MNYQQRSKAGALIITLLVLTLATTRAVDSLTADTAGQATHIDLTADQTSDTLTLNLTFINGDAEGRGRQLVLVNHAPFPVEVSQAFGAEAGEWYDLVVTNGTHVTGDGVVIARNIYPNDTGSCGDPDEPPCEYTLQLELTLHLVSGGGLAPQGDYALSFQLIDNENPITIDFSDFFKGLEYGADAQ